MRQYNPFSSQHPGHSVQAILLLLLSGLLCSCAMLPPGAQAGNNGRDSVASKRSSLVARDLVSALAQIGTLDPQVTRLQIAKPDSSYGKVLVQELQRAGYDLQIAKTARGQNYLRYSIESVTSEIGAAFEFGLTVDSVKLRRQYRLQGDLIKPASSLFVFGAAPESIVLDDSLFSDKASDSSLQAPWAKTAEIQDSRPEPGFATVKLMENMYETRRSHYADVLQDYADVRKVVLVFGNDSISMGKRNKGIARELVEDFNAATDVISVIGCSHGKSAVAGQNRSLALGRASRVREELILSGVNPSQVLDEGCWAGVHFDDVMPRRGVVVTLKREKM